jgi:predicted amidohydrolase YtcJ
LIILSQNPLAIDPDEIIDIEVLMTMVGGNVEHCLPGHEPLCADPGS